MRASLPIASGPRRVLAVFIDFWAFFLTWFAIGILQPVNSLLYAAGFFLALNTILTAFFGLTPGRLAAGIRLVRAADGRRPGWRATMLRTGVVLLAGLLGPFIYVIRLASAGPVHRMWWDSVAGTQLVQLQRRAFPAGIQARAGPGLNADAFRELVGQLTLGDLQEVYGTSGLGIKSMTGRSPDLSGSASDAYDIVAHKLGLRRYLRGGAINFETVVSEKLIKALRTVAAGPALPDEDFVAGTSPFLSVLPVGWPADRPRVAELRRREVRTPILESYIQTLHGLAASEIVSSSLLPASESDLRTALCLESIGAGDKLATELADGYVSLCNFVAEPAAAHARANVTRCQKDALSWLGHGAAAEMAIAPLGSRPVKALAETEDASEWITGFGYLYGMFGVFIALGQCQKSRYGAGLVALVGTYLPLGLLWGLEWLQKRRGTRPLRASVRGTLIVLAAVVTPLVWAASCWGGPPSA